MPPDFPTWYAERHGYQPFPWQAALAARIAAGDWPDALDPPTGSGKTAVIDVWLWARLRRLAVPRRLVYVIDRRLVVDSVTAYANALAASLPGDHRLNGRSGGLAAALQRLRDQSARGVDPCRAARQRRPVRRR